MNPIKLYAPIAWLCVALSPASAAVINFDFEGETATFIDAPGFARPGALTSLSISQGGLTMTITRENGERFDLVRNVFDQAGKPAGWGLISLDPAFNFTGQAFNIDFSRSITEFSVQFGDFGGDAPDVLQLSAFSGPGGTGALLDNDITGTFSGAFPAFSSGSVSAAGINSIVMIGGTLNGPHSVFYDNISVTDTLIPEPGSLALLGLGLMGFAWLRRLS
jgi:PEP-CTERM motif